MQRLLDFVVRYKEFISFTALVIISFSLISMGDVSKIGGYRTFIIGSMGWFQEIFAWIPNPGALESENQALRNLNLQLSSEVTRMRQAVIENEKLRRQIGFLNEQEYRHLPAEVSGKTSIQMRNFITLNKGESSGIKRGMAVRNDAGLIGIVMGTTDNFSLVELITNREVKVAGKIQRSSVDGILNWEGGTDFSLRNIPKSFDVRLNDTVLTSNYSNKYPPDIPLGYIVNIEDDPSALFKKITVKPFADFGRIEQVFVIEYLPDEERIRLIQQVEELLKARTGEAAKKSKQSSKGDRR